MRDFVSKSLAFTASVTCQELLIALIFLAIFLAILLATAIFNKLNSQGKRTSWTTTIIPIISIQYSQIPAGDESLPSPSLRARYTIPIDATTPNKLHSSLTNLNLRDVFINPPPEFRFESEHLVI